MIDISRIECLPVLDLLDDADELELPEPHAGWVPVLADVRGSVPLDDLALHLPEYGHPAQQVAAALRRYRVRKRDLDEPAPRREG